MQWIEAYVYCPVCGSRDYPLESGRRRCAVCGFIDFNNVLLAVGVWVLDAQDRLLLIERARDPGKGRLAPPGGFADPGESIEETARREVREETGIEVEQLTYLDSGPNDYAYAGRTRPVCDVFFTTRVREISVTPEAGEVSGWRVLPLSDVDPQDLAFPSIRQSFHRLLQEFLNEQKENPL